MLCSKIKPRVMRLAAFGVCAASSLLAGVTLLQVDVEPGHLVGKAAQQRLQGRRGRVGRDSGAEGTQGALPDHPHQRPHPLLARE